MTLLRKVLRRIYISGWLFRRNEWVGRVAILFYRLIYEGFTVGRDATVWGGFRILMFGPGTISIGERFHAVSSPGRSGITLFSRIQMTTYPGAEIRIGDRVALNGTVITSKKRVEIGDGTMIAPNVIIVDTDFHAKWPPDGRFVSSTEEVDREVVIGRNVWIGMNSTVLKGVTIGDNSIIGAASLVATSIPANVIAGGNPARVLRRLDESGDVPAPAPDPTTPDRDVVVTSGE